MRVQVNVYSMDSSPAEKILRTCDFRIVRASFDVFVSELDGNPIFTGCRWEVRDGNRAILVIVATDVRFTGTFDGQRKATCSSRRDD